jgi:putative glutamine amidotransferase
MTAVSEILKPFEYNNLTSTMKKPLIGIVPLYDIERTSYWMLPGYMQAVEYVGGLPVILPLTENSVTLRQSAEQFDGFLFTGGQDIAPEWYGEKTTAQCGPICPKRDSMDKLLLQFVVELDKPALGICRGLQLMNVFFGGTLYQDIPAQLKTENPVQHLAKPPTARVNHAVFIEPKTLLSEILQTETTEIRVNSWHHQGIRRLALPLKSAARSPDGLTECTYHPDKRFIFAVQWHPEISWQTDLNSQRIFEYFVQQCKQ